MTIRQAISTVRNKLKEVNSDSRVTPKQIYSDLISKSNIIIQRESDALRLANVQSMYQSLKCIEVAEVPAIDKYCKIKSSRVLYRTKAKIPDLYFDTNGPILSSITSLDRSYKVYLDTSEGIRRTMEDSNFRYNKDIYAFYEDGYLYLTKKLPIRVEAFFVSDVSQWCNCECSDDKPCLRFLDTQWFIPKKLEDPIITLIVQEYANGYKRFPEQIIPDKNPQT